MDLPIRLRVPLPASNDASLRGKSNAGARDIEWSPLPFLVLGGGSRACRAVSALLGRANLQVPESNGPIIDLICSQRHLKSKELAGLVAQDSRIRWTDRKAGDLARLVQATFTSPTGQLEQVRPIVIVEADYGHQFDREEWLPADLKTDPMADPDGTPGHIAFAEACRKVGLLVHVWGFPELSHFDFDEEWVSFEGMEGSEDAESEEGEGREGLTVARSPSRQAPAASADDDTRTLRSPSPPAICSLPESPVTRPASTILDNLPLDLLSSSLAQIDTRVSSASAESQTTSNNTTLVRRGTLSLVGSGPGHPAHLTLLALSTLLAADTIISDRLVSPQILDLALSLSPRKPELKIAGKHCGRAHLAQEEIYKWTEEALSRGHNVVRLKSGDPFVFGRGGEEHIRFASLGHNVHVVPGLSSALVAPLAGLVPVTHRGIADQLLIATGLKEDGSMPLEFPDYSPTRTCVFLMAMGKLPDLCNVLTKTRGFPLETPAAVIEKATWGSQGLEQEALDRLLGVFCVPRTGRTSGVDTGADGGQRVVRATLGTVASVSKEVGITNHAVVVVGRVVEALNVA